MTKHIRCPECKEQNDLVSTRGTSKIGLPDFIISILKAGKAKYFFCGGCDKPYLYIDGRFFVWTGSRRGWKLFKVELEKVVFT